MAEILSPAGSPEHAYAAVKSGADAIYLGLKKFSARGNASNFDDAELREIVSYCHARGVKVYAAVNTMLFDSELDECAELLGLLCDVGVDAVIAQDLALPFLAQICCPQLELHASTQMTLHTQKGCEFAKRLGFERTVLSRELPMEIIKELTANGGTETEVFVHGALCMSVSGQCLMSAVIGGRSANRGICAQPCRLPCSAARGREDHALSLKDMSVLESLPELAAANVDSLKIEGRMKRPEYAALSAHCAASALVSEKYDKRLLETVFSRGGFTDGYLAGKRGAEMFGRRTKEDSEAANAAYPRIHELYRRERKRSRLDFFVTVRAGEPLRISACDENGLYAEYEGELPQAAKNRPCDEELVRRQLSKLGDTFYEFGTLTCDIGDGLAVSSSELNAARRDIVESICRQREEFFSRRVPFDKSGFDLSRGKRSPKRYELRINAQSAKQLEMISQDDISLAFLPLDIKELKAAPNAFDAQRLGVCMPRFTFDEEADIRLLKQAAKLGMKHVLCTNFAHIIAAEELGMIPHAAAGLNTANTPALEMLERLGAADAVVSPELRSAQINALGGTLPIGVTAYGRLPLMLTVNCPISATEGCKNCTGRVFDRTGREFPVKCSKRQGYTELLNSDMLCISDKTADFPAADFFQLEFFDESPERAARIVKSFIERKPYPFDEKVTRGLYYRGLKK